MTLPSLQQNLRIEYFRQSSLFSEELKVKGNVRKISQFSTK